MQLHLQTVPGGHLHFVRAIHAWNTPVPAEDGAEVEAPAGVELPDEGDDVVVVVVVAVVVAEPELLLLGHAQSKHNPMI